MQFSSRMSDNLILYEPVESENGLSCPYPGCNKCVDFSKRTQLEAHIRSHRKRKRKNKNVSSIEKEKTDDVKVEVVEIETIDQNDNSDNNVEKLVEFELSDDNTGVTCQKRKRKAVAENDPNQNENEIDPGLSKDKMIRCPVSECDKTFDAAFQIWNHLRDHKKSNFKNKSTLGHEPEISSLERYIQKHGLSNHVSDKNEIECVDFTVKIEEESYDPEPSETVTPAAHSDDQGSSEMFIQSTDQENEIVLPIDDEIIESKPDIKVEEINTERKEDWFYVRDEDSIKRMFVCKLCHAEYEYLHQLHRHAFACPYKKEIGHTKIKNLVRNQFVLPRSQFLTKVKTKPPKLVRTKGSYYCDICQQVSF